jgi:hypothetical protein
MLAYEVFLNGERQALAGIDGECIMSVQLTHGVKKQTDYLRLLVHGLACATNEQLQWTCSDPKVGDEIRIRVLDAPSVDEPVTRWPYPALNDDDRKRLVRTTAKELGWTVSEVSDQS